MHSILIKLDCESNLLDLLRDLKPGFPICQACFCSKVRDPGFEYRSTSNTRCYLTKVHNKF